MRGYDITAESGPFLRVIPTHSCSLFRFIPAAHSKAKLHPFKNTSRLPEGGVHRWHGLAARDMEARKKWEQSWGSEKGVPPIDSVFWGIWEPPVAVYPYMSILTSTSYRASYEHTESEGTGVFINIFTVPNHMDVFLNV